MLRTSLSKAESIGLVNRVDKGEEMLAKAGEMAMVIAQKGPIVVKMAKTLIKENQEITKGLEKELDFFARCFYDTRPSGRDKCLFGEKKAHI